MSRKKKNIILLKDVMPLSSDTVRRRKGRSYRGRVDRDLVARCNQAWESKRNIRETRERTNNYTFGDQWGDVIYYKCGYITEREYLKKKHNVPLTNNIMISIFSTVTGLYAKQSTEPVCFARTSDAQWLSDMMSATVQANWQDTYMPDVLLTVFKDYLCGGVAMVRESYEERNEVFDTWTDYINPNYAFWEGGSDPRHQDITLIGVLHDCSRPELYAKFVKPELGISVEDIDEIFGFTDDFNESSGLQQNEENSLANISFSSAANKSFRRVIEVWTKETKLRYQCTDPIATNADDARFRCELSDIGKIREINVKRKMMYDNAGVPKEQRAYIKTKLIVDSYWYYTFLAPDGTVLCEGETPYEFKDHPFTLKLFPFVNGEVHPFMGNIIDQQRYINRLIVMHDMAARSSAKGITIVPKSCIPDDMTPQEFADEFTEYDGLIFYETSRLNPNARPEIITSNAVQIGTTELLQMQLNLTKEITNVSGALQGKTPSAGTSASRYFLEQQNATTSLFALLSDMTVFTEKLARKKVSNIKQYYDDGRPILNKDNTDLIEYNRLSARDVMFKVSIKESAATAAYQTQINDTALQLLQLGAINIMQYLQCVNLPFKDRLLQQVQSDEAQQQMQQQLLAQQQQMSPQQQQMSQQNVQQTQQMLRSA